MQIPVLKIVLCSTSCSSLVKKNCTACYKNIVILDNIYTVGGYAGYGRAAKASGEHYDFTKNTWYSIKDMHKGRYGHAVVSMKGERFFP